LGKQDQLSCNAAALGGVTLDHRVRRYLGAKHIVAMAAGLAWVGGTLAQSDAQNHVDSRNGGGQVSERSDRCSGPAEIGRAGWLRSLSSQQKAGQKGGGYTSSSGYSENYADFLSEDNPAGDSPADAKVPPKEN
jgi:hypothetical protein